MTELSSSGSRGVPGEIGFREADGGALGAPHQPLSSPSHPGVRLPCEMLSQPRRWQSSDISILP